MSDEGVSPRFEDDFAKVIKVPYQDFKKLARSRYGLCLEEREIDEIEQDNPTSEERKIKMLWRWRSKNPSATPGSIFGIVERFKESNPNKESGDDEKEHLDGNIWIYPKKRIGVGSSVSKGIQKSHRKDIPLAIKLIDWGEDAEHEGDILVGLNHQNIVKFIASGHVRTPMDKLYIAMELYHEDNLHEHIGKHVETFCVEATYSRAGQLSSGLHYLHSKNIMHRDLKPHNILLSLDLKELKITDFGISKQVTDTRSCTSTTNRSLIGTNGYRAPEAYNEGKYTKKGDVFSLGLVIYFIWSDGKHPFGEDPDSWNLNIKRYQGPDLTQLQLPSEDHSKAWLFLKCLLNCRKEKRQDMDTIKKWISEDGFLMEFSEFQRKQQPKQNICIFTKTSKLYPLSVCSLDPSDQPDDENEVYLEKIVSVEEFTRDTFTAVAVRDCIYILTWVGYTYVARPQHLDKKWAKVDSDTIFLHGRWPSATATENSIYLCGGGWDDTTGYLEERGMHFPAASVDSEVFHVEEGTWHSIKKMNEARRLHALAADEKYVYALGGTSEEGTVLCSAERYDLQKDKWETIPSLNTGRFKAAATAHGGNIYILGGKAANFSTLSDVETYRPGAETWTIIEQKLTFPRSLFCACVCNSKIFAVAGDASGRGKFPTVMSIEMWDPTKDEGWTKFKNLDGDLERPATIVFAM